MEPQEVSLSKLIYTNSHSTPKCSPTEDVFNAV